MPLRSNENTTRKLTPRNPNSHLAETQQVGNKQYTLSNHLGNVLEVVTDMKRSVEGTPGQTDHYTADVVSWSDYMPFGSQMEGRNGSTGVYRYGFQGQERDDEIKGQGNSINYKYRMHDPRLGRFFAVDPLASDYPWNSPYAFSENRVLDAIEVGMPDKIVSNKDKDGNEEKSLYIRKAALKWLGINEEAEVEIDETEYQVQYQLGTRITITEKED